MASTKHYYERKALGLCTECGERSPEENRVLCGLCNQKKKDKAHAWYAEHKDRFLANERRRYHELKVLAYEKLGNACACCGETEKDFLSLDHIGGRGQEHRTKLCGTNAGGGIKVLRSIVNGLEGFQLLCFNCHMCISLRGFCPHRLGTEDIRFKSNKVRWKTKPY